VVPRYEYACEHRVDEVLDHRVDEVLEAEHLGPARPVRASASVAGTAAEGARRRSAETIALGLAAAAQSESSRRRMPATGMPTQSGRLLSS